MQETTSMSKSALIFIYRFSRPSSSKSYMAKLEEALKREKDHRARLLLEEDENRELMRP